MKLVAECIFHIRRVLPNISNNTRHFCRHRIGGSLPSGIINGTSNKRQRFINPSGRVKNYNLSIYRYGSSENNYKNIDNKEWIQRLTPLQYEVCRLKGTEHPFTSPYIHTHLKGTYFCVCCGSELFSSETKFDSGSGWPSFFSCIPNKIEEMKDTSHGMLRVEVLCKNCNAHLGHVFDDGPKPTGHRYCINGVCLNFKEQ